MKQKENELFRGRLEFLSNMAPCPIKYKGLEFTCTESAYQSMKCSLIIDKKKFVGLDGYQAKQLGRKIKIRDDWDKIKFLVMKEILELKFKKEPFRSKLIEMEGQITEFNYWNDTYWGVCNGVGDNNLGKILMNIRDKLAKTKNIYNENLYTRKNYIKYDHIGFTANSTLTRDFRLVMGAGNAKFVRDKVKGIDKRIGSLVYHLDRDIYGILHDTETKMFAFQTKIDWKNKSPISVTLFSLLMLKREAKEKPNLLFALPIPGIGHGGFTREEIEPYLYDMPDNVHFYWI